MIPLTHVLNIKIQSYIKNGLDISDLIADVDIKNADLTGAVIKNIRLIDKDISSCNFTATKIGNPDNPCFFIRCNMNNCNFEGGQFTGKVMVRSCKAHNCNFRNADIAKAEYQYSDFTDSTFCNAIIKIGTREGLGCIFPIKMFQDLCEGWKMKIKAEPIE